MALFLVLATTGGGASAHPGATLRELARHRTPRVPHVSYHLILFSFRTQIGPSAVKNLSLRSAISSVFCVISATACFPPSS